MTVVMNWTIPTLLMLFVFMKVKSQMTPIANAAEIK